MFHKILIANRGEIALRIIRTCRELGIRTVVAHSKADGASLPRRLADESICVGPDAARLSYLTIPAIISAAAVTDSEAIHPGYGFLAENAAFADVCRACSITFIGPSPEAIRLMGNKAQARQLAKQAGVAVVPGSEAPLKDAAEAVDVTDRIGYPIIFKAAAGGGGRGMRIVRRREDVAQAFDACQSEAGSAFGSAEIYCEKYVERAACRGPGARRQERDAPPPRRARVLRATPPPEAPRGVAGAQPRRRDAKRPLPRGADRGGGGQLRKRRDRRVHRGRRGALLLHRDEHAHPGRAPRHRDGHGHRPGARADPHRRG